MHSNPYLRYYQQQVGGSADIPVFIGGQHGAGLGDFFRSVLRFIAPIALRGISTFASNTMRAHESGASLKDAARGAIKPSIGAIASAVHESLNKPQAGSGAGALFTGDEGIPFKGVRIYNGVSRKRKAKPKKRAAKRSKKQAHHDHGDGYNF